MSKKTHSMAVLFSFFVKISISDPLSLHNLLNDISECIKELDLIREQLKLLSSTKVPLLVL